MASNLDQTSLATINKVASNSFVSDIVAAAATNPRVGAIQYGGELAEKLASAGYSNVEIAKLAGSLSALAEGGFSLKEASELLQQPEAALEMVIQVTGI